MVVELVAGPLETAQSLQSLVGGIQSAFALGWRTGSVSAGDVPEAAAAVAAADKPGSTLHLDTALGAGTAVAEAAAGWV